MDKEIEKGGFNVHVSDELIDGVYSNLAVVMHSQSEFLLDFIRLLPNQEQCEVKSRVIMTPDNVKRLMHVLIKNVHEYEDMFGEIKLPEIAGEADPEDKIYVPPHIKGEA